MPVVNTFFASYLLRILIVIVITWLAAKAASWLAVRMLMVRVPSTLRAVDERRRFTLQSLVGGAVTGGVYIIGFITALLVLNVQPGLILTTLGLFSAGLGIGARPVISDYLAGIILIFEDLFSVGDKVEMIEVIGLVEAVNLRTTLIRSTTGELYIVPNGDVRVVRNLSRGLFSVATVKVTVASSDLSKALEVLEQMANIAQAQIPDLIERPEFVSEEGLISAHVELTLAAKASYGRGARVRTRLMAWVIDALNEAGVQIINN